MSSIISFRARRSVDTQQGVKSRTTSGNEEKEKDCISIKFRNEYSTPKKLKNKRYNNSRPVVGVARLIRIFPFEFLFNIIFCFELNESHERYFVDLKYFAFLNQLWNRSDSIGLFFKRKITSCDIQNCDLYEQFSMRPIFQEANSLI